MTSISTEYLEKELAESAEESKKFAEWCSARKVKSIWGWMHERGLQPSDLYSVGLLRVERSLISGIYSKDYYTDAASQTICIPDEFRRDGSEIDRAWIVDELQLLHVLSPQLIKTEAQRRKDYRRYYKDKYGGEPPPIETELPLRLRKDTVGPFCELTERHRVQEPYAQFCNWCGESIFRKPKIGLRDQILCYRCGKLSHEILLRASAWVEQRLLRESKERCDEWEGKLRNFLAAKDIGTKLKEFFGQKKSIYASGFLSANPKPQLIVSIKATPNIFLVEHFSIRAPRKEVIERDNNECQLCGSWYDLEVHHVIPKAQRGKEFAENLITLCKGCHDEEDMFGHRRAYKQSDSSRFSYKWDWDAAPDLFRLSEDEIAADLGYFKIDCRYSS
jgi:hypothetical protein